MTTVERRTLLDRYREGPLLVEQALAGISAVELDAPQPDGEWTVREIVHHVGDSELISAIRLRQLLAEDEPRIQAYDEAEYARRLRYRERPIEASLAAARAARETSASLLEGLSDEDWERSGTHSESGRYTVAGWLEIYARHCHDHAAQIRRARSLPG